MNVTGEQIRRQLMSASDEELRHIADGGGGAYTKVGRQEARRLLIERQSGAEEDAQARKSSMPPVSYAVENVLFAPFDAIRRRWDALVPEHVPSGIRRLFYVGASAVVTAGLLCVVILTTSSDLETVYTRLTTRSSLYILAVGLAGLCLSYGIKTEQRYAQYLAVFVVAMSAGAAILDELMTGNIGTGLYAIGAAAFGTVQYLFRSPEATDYYRNLRGRRSRRDVAERSAA